jgi:AraC family transcriptional regulator
LKKANALLPTHRESGHIPGMAERESLEVTIPTASLYLWNGLGVLLFNAAEAESHRHHALQVVIGLSQPFKLHSDIGDYENWVAIIAPDQPHRFDCREDWEAVCLIDPETILARQLEERYLRDTNIGILGLDCVEPFMAELRTYIRQIRPARQAKAFFDAVLSSLAGPLLRVDSFDPRIQSVLEMVGKHQIKKLSTSEVAKAIHISESRLIHQFTEQVGISWRSYLLWARLMDAILKSAQGIPLTDAAHEAGFADSAHLSRTFKRMFGMTPSEIFKNSRYIQVILGDEI